MSGQQSKTYPKTLYTFSAYFPLTIFLISFSLFSASIGVRLFTSRFNISSRSLPAYLHDSRSLLPTVYLLCPVGDYQIQAVSISHLHVSQCFSAYRPSLLHEYRKSVHYRHVPVYEGRLLYYQLLSPILDALERFLHLIQFMIMRSK